MPVLTHFFVPVLLRTTRLVHSYIIRAITHSIVGRVLFLQVASIEVHVDHTLFRELSPPSAGPPPSKTLGSMTESSGDTSLA